MCPFDVNGFFVAGVETGNSTEMTADAYRTAAVVSARHGTTEVRMGARRKLSQHPITVDDRLIERFSAKVRRLNGDDSCWLWTGAGRGNGYGAIKVNGETLDTHVVSWRIANSGIAVPDGNVIAHRCDVRLCVRPDHLFLASQSENMLDAKNKGRLDDTWSRGEKAPNSVLTEDVVREARRMQQEEGIGWCRIAKKLGVSKWAIKGVLAGKNWRHVTD